MAAGPATLAAERAAPDHIVIAMQGTSSSAPASGSCHGQDCEQDHQQQHQTQTGVQNEGEMQRTVVLVQPLGEAPEATAWSSSMLQECRICLSADNQDDLVQPCSCDGTVKYAHLECLKSWVQERQQLECELCGKPYKSNVKQHLTPLIDSSSRRLRYSRLENSVTGTIGLRAGAADGDSPAPPVVSWTRFWIQLAILVMLLVAVLYLALFVPVNTSDNFWLMFLWRVSAVALLCGFVDVATAFSSHLCVQGCRWQGQDHPACSVWHKVCCALCC